MNYVKAKKGPYRHFRPFRYPPWWDRYRCTWAAIGSSALIKHYPKRKERASNG